MGKGFILTNQKVVLDLDLSGNATGFTELTIQPLLANLTTVYLNARECRIKSVTLASGQALSYNLATPLRTAVTTPCNSTNIRSAYPELKRRLYQATNEAEEGELAVVLPAGTVKKAGPLRNGSLAPPTIGVDGAASPDPNAKTPGGQNSKDQEYEALNIIIDYDIRNPKDGIQVVKPTDLYPHRIPHCYTSAAVADAARCWVPCVDSLWERCTWELILSVPRILSYEQETDQGIEVEEFPIVCVASGELVEQVIHPHNPNKSIFHFMQGGQTTVQHIGFAYGPFSILDLSPSSQQAANAEYGLDDIDAPLLPADAEGQLQMHAFCLPGREEELSNSVSFMSRALDFMAEEFGSYPYNSFKMVFVDDCPFTMMNSAALGIFTAELLFPENIIDQAYETRQTLAYSLASQWIGINIIQKTWADTWLIQGLSLYLNGLVLKRLMGNNEYRFRLKKDVARCCAWDVRMPPLCQPGVSHPPPADILPFINLKAPLVLHILDRQLLKAGTHNGLSRIIPKLLLSAISGDLKENLLSTHNFLRMCRKVSGADLRGFAEQWIYAAGCPRFFITATFNRKRMAVELSIKQESPAYIAYVQGDWTDKVALRPVQLFEGQMTVRIHEADGTPYEHVIDIRDHYKKHEVSFNTKYKRIRRSTKRFQARKAQEEAAAAGDMEAIEAVGMIDTSFSLPLWEDSKDPNTERNREKWKVADWSAEDEKAQEQAVYEWIRIDTEFEWLAVVSFEQPDFMWLSQLQRDRDVIAQMEAIHALSNIRSAIVASTLAKTALVTNYFYRIRVEAILGLVASASKSVDYLGLFYLFKIFQTLFCFEQEHEAVDAFSFRCVPRPNDFTDFAEYHLRKTIVIAISHVRDEGRPIPQVQQFLIDLLKYNDNASNNWSDAFYITAVIAALGSPFMSQTLKDQSELMGPYYEPLPEQALIHSAVDEVTRYINLDRLVPTYHNTITVAGIEWRVKMMMASLIPLDMRFLLAYTREGNYGAVRSAAFEGILLLRGLQEKIIARYIFAVLRFDSNRIVQRRLAQSLVENLPILAAMDDLTAPDAGSLDEGAHNSKKSEKDQVENLLKALRTHVGRSITLRDSMMAVLLGPDTDIETRWCLLKICEILIKPSEEPLPKIKLRMPVRLPSAATAKAGSPEVALAVAAGQNKPKIKLGGQEVIRKDSDVAVIPPPAIKLVLGKKGATLLKEQRAGMSMADLKVCQNLMQKLLSTKKADLFRRPVDPIRDGAPSYFEHIKQPMDLSTMSGKLDAGMYKDRFAFRDDFKLMVNNCYLYNGTESLAGQLADTFDVYFDKLWDRANTTLETLRIKSGQSAVSAASAEAPYHGHGEPGVVAAAPVPALADSAATAPAAPPVSEETFAVPLPPTPAATLPPSTTAGPLRLKLSLGASGAASNGATAATQAAPTPPPVTEAPVGSVGDPVKRARSNTAASARATPAAESAPPTSRPASRSSSPAVPLSVAAATNPPPYRPKIKFSARPKQEPVDDKIDFTAPAPPKPVVPTHVSPPPSRNGSASAEPSGPPKPKKIRLSINGMGSFSAASPGAPTAQQNAAPYVPSPSYVPPSQYSASPGPAPALAQSYMPPPPHRNGSHVSMNRAQSVSSAGDASTVPVNYKRMAALIRKLLNMEESFYFRRPVDPIADGVPTYYQEIQFPMDLGTMQMKLNNGQYRVQSELNDDFEQIVTNCKIFNPPGTVPVLHAEALQRVWWSEASKAGKLSYQEKRALQGMMNRLRQRPSAAIFLDAVDPIALGIPMYFEIIPQQDARDLGLIKRRLDNDEYSTPEALEADFRLMVNNCLVFNGEGSPAYEVGQTMEAEFDREFEAVQAQLGTSGGGSKNGKRQSTGGPDGSGSIKKIKIR